MVNSRSQRSSALNTTSEREGLSQRAAEAGPGLEIGISTMVSAWIPVLSADTAKSYRVSRLERNRNTIHFAGFCYREPEFPVPNRHAVRHLNNAVHLGLERRQHDLPRNPAALPIHFEERTIDAFGAPERSVRVPAH